MTRLYRCGPGGGLSPADFSDLKALIKSGKIFCFPTDTVYGLGCSAFSSTGRRRIFEIKGRPYGKPLPFFVHSVVEARRWALWTQTAQKLAKRHWPGALTLVLRPSEEGRALLSPGADSLALRIPDHALLIKLLRGAGEPWATTSANISGQKPAGGEKELIDVFQDLADAIVLAGPCGGIASTVVDAREDRPKVLRQGTIEI